MTKVKPTIKLKLDKNYESFNQFYDDNRDVIYKSIIDIFNQFLTTDKIELTLSVNAKIDNLDWGTDFTFTKNQKITLSRDILPYFEMVEDYDTCIKIRDLIKKLNGG
jgi:hypothetical protein